MQFGKGLQVLQIRLGKGLQDLCRSVSAQDAVNLSEQGADQLRIAELNDVAAVAAHRPVQTCVQKPQVEQLGTIMVMRLRGHVVLLPAAEVLEPGTAEPGRRTGRGTASGWLPLPLSVSRTPIYTPTAHLGHARVSETQDTYMARGRVHTQVAELLERTVARHTRNFADVHPTPPHAGYRLSVRRCRRKDW
jgi:hypothetical protein